MGQPARGAGGAGASCRRARARSRPQVALAQPLRRELWPVFWWPPLPPPPPSVFMAHWKKRARAVAPRVTILQRLLGTVISPPPPAKGSSREAAARWPRPEISREGARAGRRCPPAPSPTAAGEPPPESRCYGSRGLDTRVGRAAGAGRGRLRSELSDGPGRGPESACSLCRTRGSNPGPRGAGRAPGPRDRIPALRGLAVGTAEAGPG